MSVTLKIEEAREESSGDLIGYLLSIDPGGDTVLVWANQNPMYGFRVGKGFTPAYGDQIIYRTVGLHTGETTLKGE